MTTLVMPCSVRKCKWLYGPKGPDDDVVWVCRAFPLGIPKEIVSGENLHEQPFQDDHGIVYKKDPMSK